MLFLHNKDEETSVTSDVMSLPLRHRTSITYEGGNGKSMDSGGGRYGEPHWRSARHTFSRLLTAAEYRHGEAAVVVCILPLHDISNSASAVLNKVRLAYVDESAHSVRQPYLDLLDSPCRPSENFIMPNFMSSSVVG
jgi:hypothetical protein